MLKLAKHSEECYKKAFCKCKVCHKNPHHLYLSETRENLEELSLLLGFSALLKWYPTKRRLGWALIFACCVMKTNRYLSYFSTIQTPATPEILCCSPDPTPMVCLRKFQPNWDKTQGLNCGWFQVLTGNQQSHSRFLILRLSSLQSWSHRSSPLVSAHLGLLGHPAQFLASACTSILCLVKSADISLSSLIPLSQSS